MPFGTNKRKKATCTHECAGFFYFGTYGSGLTATKKIKDKGKSESEQEEKREKRSQSEGQR